MFASQTAARVTANTTSATTTTINRRSSALFLAASLFRRSGSSADRQAGPDEPSEAQCGAAPHFGNDAGSSLTGERMTKRAMFLISDTGGGHRSAANAITAALDEITTPASFEHRVEDVAAHCSFPLTQLGLGYSMALRYAPPVYGALYYAYLVDQMHGPGWLLPMALR